MKIGIFNIKEVDEIFHIESNSETFEVCSTFREAINIANTFMRVHEMSYKMGYKQRNNEIIEDKEYHYM